MLFKLADLIVLSTVLTTAISTCYASQIKIACGTTAAPWIMSESKSGILVDILHEALEPLGYDITVLYYPYNRRVLAYKSKRIDAFCDVNEANIEHSALEGHYSGPVYQFENYFYSLKKNNFNFNSIDDITRYSLHAWQGASYTLKGDYQAMANRNRHYYEGTDQKAHIKSLYSGRIDVVQMDKQIFQYYRAKVAQEGEVDINQPVDVFSFLGVNPNGFLFRSESLRDTFVKQIELMKESGRFQAILDKYGK